MRGKFIKSILGGAAISIGAIVYLATDNVVVGTFLFSLGLFIIYRFGLHLYTGKVCLIPEKPPRFLIEVVLVYTGNLIGTLGMGWLLKLTKLVRLQEAAAALTAAKLTDTMLSAFIMAALCGVMLSVAVLGYTTAQDGVGKHLILIMPIMVFLLAGFEHSIANLFFISFSDSWGLKAVLYSAIYAAGNLVGGVILPLAARLSEES